MSPPRPAALGHAARKLRPWRSATQTRHAARARAALRARDFRKLLWIRLSGQGGDGIFLAALTASVVFNPEQQNTAQGLLVDHAW